MYKRRGKKSKSEEKKFQLSRMEEFGPISLLASEFKNETHDYPNRTGSDDSEIPHIANFTLIFNVILLTLCFLGLVGNGKVIWILGFQMKMNSFSIYVLNLAVADSGVLITEVLMQIFQLHNSYDFTEYYIYSLLYFVLYNASQLLLLSISVDRCVSVLFPIWHQCHRPPKLSLIVCAIAWVLPCLYFALEMVIIFSQPFLLFQLIFNGLISYPVVAISSLILLVKVFYKHRHQKRKRVLRLTLLSLMCFIVFRLPLSVYSIINYIILKNIDLASLIGELLLKPGIESKMLVDFFLMLVQSFHPWFHHMIILAMLSDICVVVNSTINPILYFLAGRNKMDRSRISMNLALHRVFRNEEDIKEEEAEPDETQL